MEPFIVLPSVLTIGLFTWGVRIVLKMRGRKVLVREFLSYFSELGHEVRIHADGPAIMGELGHMNVPPPNGRGQPLGTKEPASGVLVATPPGQGQVLLAM